MFWRFLHINYSCPTIMFPCEPDGTGRGRSPHLRTLLLNHWGLDGRATEDGRPYLTAVRRAGGIVVGATVLGRPSCQVCDISTKVYASGRSPLQQCRPSHAKLTCRQILRFNINSIIRIINHKTRFCPFRFADIFSWTIIHGGGGFVFCLAVVCG